MIMDDLCSALDSLYDIAIYNTIRIENANLLLEGWRALALIIIILIITNFITLIILGIIINVKIKKKSAKSWKFCRGSARPWRDDSK